MPGIDNSQLWTESIRITVFWAPGQHKDRNFFRELFGCEAEIVNANAPSGTKHYEGVVDGAKYIIDVNAQTFNVIILGVDQVGFVPGVTLPPQKWLDSSIRIDKLFNQIDSSGICDATPRLAFAPIVFIEAASPEDAIMKLQPYLPFEIGGNDRSDFIFQNNVRKQIGLENGKQIIVNRLANASATQIMMMQVGMFGGPQFLGEPQFRAQITLDFNNAVSLGVNSSFTKSEARDILVKMRKLVDETLSQGLEL